MTFYSQMCSSLASALLRSPGLPLFWLAQQVGDNPVNITSTDTVLAHTYLLQPLHHWPQLKTHAQEGANGRRKGSIRLARSGRLAPAIASASSGGHHWAADGGDRERREGAAMVTARAGWVSDG